MKTDDSMVLKNQTSSNMSMTYIEVIFFLQKQNDIRSFKSRDYIIQHR